MEEEGKNHKSKKSYPRRGFFFLFFFPTLLGKEIKLEGEVDNQKNNIQKGTKNEE